MGTRKNRKTRRSSVYTKKDYESGDGMLTSVWGPSMWHYLHTMSFNYPDNPTKEDKENYKSFIQSLKNILPQKGNILDVGCSCGGMLKPFLEQGWNGLGTDPDNEFVKYGRDVLKMPVNVSSAENMKLKKKKI